MWKNPFKPKFMLPSSNLAYFYVLKYQIKGFPTTCNFVYNLHDMGFFCYSAIIWVFFRSIPISPQILELLLLQYFKSAGPFRSLWGLCISKKIWICRSTVSLKPVMLQAVIWSNWVSNVGFFFLPKLLW